ncbi:MAG: Crp/Fnr family transcriptional regulator [Clostridiales Family XIII bacterium]|jgi:CRP-like cAMP-binding protein|nr:Crp/Fnr family transcriptional regulator [Clostridiales Family XIII bacterium]
MNTSIILKSALFAGIEKSQLESLLGCLSATQRVCKKGEFIFLAGKEAASVGLVMSGSVHILQEDSWGNRMILARFGPGELFGEAFSCAGAERLPVSVIAAARSEILLIDYRKIVTSCSAACVFHARLVENMLRILAEKNILLTRKLAYFSQRTIRGKLLSFLSDQAIREGSDAKNTVVEIAFNRQELADYLCVDRSALSRELGAMQSEGLIRYRKNRFEIMANDGQRQ